MFNHQTETLITIIRDIFFLTEKISISYCCIFDVCR